MIFWWLIIMTIALTGLLLGYAILTNEELKGEIMNSIQLLKDG